MLKSNRLKAFTLVELLVVIGIIAVLISLLLPALNKARASAVTLTCTARMRQLTTASLLFAAENQGSLPPIFAGSATNYTWPWNPRVAKAIFPVYNVYDAQGNVDSNGTREFGYLSQYLSASLDPARLYVCRTLES